MFTHLTKKLEVLPDVNKIQVLVEAEDVDEVAGAAGVEDDREGGGMILLVSDSGDGGRGRPERFSILVVSSSSLAARSLAEKGDQKQIWPAEERDRKGLTMDIQSPVSDLELGVMLEGEKSYRKVSCMVYKVVWSNSKKEEDHMRLVVGNKRLVL